MTIPLPSILARKRRPPAPVQLSSTLASLQRRASGGGNYLGLTLMITATSRQQLDDLYRALSGHALVKVVL